MTPRTLFCSPLILLAASSALAAASGSIVPTSNFIDTIAGYVDLSSCAEGVLSTIVRPQSSGCGDNNQLISYTCFCTDSSRLFSFEISSAVSESCKSSSASAQISSALKVWDSYCALGVDAGLSTTSNAPYTQTTTESASPAAGASSTEPIQTAAASTLMTSTASASASASAASASATSASSSDPGASNKSRTTAIAAGVVVPVGVIGLALAGFLFYRKRRQGEEQHVPVASTPTEMSTPVQKQEQAHELPHNQVYELPWQTKNIHDIEGDSPRHEADPDAWKRHG